jgi:hypothetical protein
MEDMWWIVENRLSGLEDFMARAGTLVAPRLVGLYGLG